MVPIENISSMRSNLFTDSNLTSFQKRLFQFIETVFFKKTQKVQKKALSTIRAFSLSKPVDGICQRVWKVLPSIRYAIHKVIAFLFPFYWRYSAEVVQSLNLLMKLRVFSEEVYFTPKEVAIVSHFFKEIKKNPSSLHTLRALASKDQYSLLEFIQGILSTSEVAEIKNKLEDIQLNKSNPLTVDEIGMIELSFDRQKFLGCLKKQNVEGIDSILSFWTQMVELKEHPVMAIFRERTLSLFSEGCLGFLSSYEDDKKVRLNLKEDSLCFIDICSRLYYLLVGNSCHVGFVFVKEGRLFTSDITPLYLKHRIRPHSIGILYPSEYLYRFKINPLLSSQVTPFHAKFLQSFFSQKLTESISIEQNVSWGFLEGVSSFISGRKTPFWDRKKIENLQSKEICTGFSAKMVYQAFLKTREKVQELGYGVDQITYPFLAHENIGRMLVADFIKYFKKKGLIELVEDPFLTACIEPGFLKEELNLLFKY